MAQVQDWQIKAQAKRDSILASLPQVYRIDASKYANERDVTGNVLIDLLEPREREITETDAEGIVAKTSTGQWTAVEVPCLLEVFFEAAIEDAKRLDSFFVEHKKPIGPLHGLPVSLKDQFHVKGVETTMGYVGWIGTFQGKKETSKEKVFESEMVRELRNLGAILYCKTTVPHTLMAGETVNNILGYTFNPKNRNLAAGGSSGGEGALISMKGSPLGFGTDIGGSIRLPAAFNGLYGLRPSSGRLPYEGMANSMDGQNSILSVVGPLATSIGALKLAVTAILSQKPWLYDPLVNPAPWRLEDEMEIKDILASAEPRLVFGIMYNDQIVAPYPPVKRALEMTARAVKAAGHEVIEWKPPVHMSAVELAGEIYSFDGAHDVQNVMEASGEPMAEPILANLHSRGAQFDASSIAAINVAKREYQKQYMDYWNSTSAATQTGRPVDAVIMPVAPFPAPLPGKFKWYGYTLILNVLDYSTCVIPVTKVDKNIDKADESFVPMNPLDDDCQGDYDPEIYDGAHVSLQIFGRRLNEEKVLAISAEVDRALRSSK